MDPLRKSGRIFPPFTKPAANNDITIRPRFAKTAALVFETGDDDRMDLPGALWFMLMAAWMDGNILEYAKPILNKYSFIGCWFGTEPAPYQVPVAAKQFLSSVATPTVATPSHIKQLIPVTTATSTQHHGKGVSFSTFTQQANAAVLGHHHQNQPPYYNTAVGQPHQYQQQQPQNQAQQQPAATRFQVYSTVATPLHKPTVVYAAQQYAQPSISAAAIYATAASPLQHQPQSSPFHYGAQLFHPQPPLQQPQPYAQLTKIAYTPGAASLQKGFYPVQ